VSSNKKNPGQDTTGLRKETEGLKTKNKELEDMLKRLGAEFDNYKKSIDKRQAEMRRYASAELVMMLLALLDSFESALKDPKCDTQGIMVLHKQLHDILSKEGLRPIEAVGQRLDPFKHEVLMQESNPEIADDTVTQEIQKGYMLHDRVLRHAKVKVNRIKNEG